MRYNIWKEFKILTIRERCATMGSCSRKTQTQPLYRRQQTHYPDHPEKNLGYGLQLNLLKGCGYRTFTTNSILIVWLSEWWISFKCHILRKSTFWGVWIIVALEMYDTIIFAFALSLRLLLCCLKNCLCGHLCGLLRCSLQKHYHLPTLRVVLPWIPLGL